MTFAPRLVPILLALLASIVPCSAQATDTPMTIFACRPSDQFGLASWYGRQFDNRRTASGERFSLRLRTAAHRDLPLGTRVIVTNLNNGLSLLVRINDRGPYVAGRIIDLSLLAARDLAMLHQGLVPVRIEVLDRD